MSKLKAHAYSFMYEKATKKAFPPKIARALGKQQASEILSEVSNLVKAFASFTENILETEVASEVDGAYPVDADWLVMTLLHLRRKHILLSSHIYSSVDDITHTALYAVVVARIKQSEWMRGLVDAHRVLSIVWPVCAQQFDCASLLPDIFQCLRDNRYVFLPVQQDWELD